MIITDSTLKRLNPEIKANGIALGEKVKFKHNNQKIYGVLYGIHISDRTTFDIAVKLENSIFYVILNDIVDISTSVKTISKDDILNNLTDIIYNLFEDQQYVSNDIPIHELDVDSLDFVEIIVKIENDLDIEIDHSKLSIADSIIVTAEKIYLMISEK